MKENLRIWAITDGGSRDSHGTDVTEAVCALYDLAIGSMDFGSGFWSAEDALPVALLARVCGFEEQEELERYAKKARIDREKTDFRRVNGFFPYGSVSPRRAHDHAWSAINGECLWPGCKASKS